MMWAGAATVAFKHLQTSIHGGVDAQGNALNP